MSGGLSLQTGPTAQVPLPSLAKTDLRGGGLWTVASGASESGSSATCWTYESLCISCCLVAGREGARQALGLSPEALKDLKYVPTGHERRDPIIPTFIHSMVKSSRAGL